MRVLVVLVEEPSARALLEGVLPRLLPAEVEVVYLVFEGKQDLERNVTRKLRGWLRPHTSFVVLRDQDANPDCKAVKGRLVELVAASGRSALVRVACRELEAWVAGDLVALGKAFDDPRVARERNKAKYREPDRLVRPAEELQRIVPGYQKNDGARRVGPLLDPAENASASFKAFCSGVRRMFAESGAASSR